MPLNDPVFKFALREDLKDRPEFLPRRAEDLSSGYDVRAAQEDRKDIVLRAGQYFKIPLGFRSFCPEGWYYHLHPRSSSFAKKQMHCLIGIVDQSWEGTTLFVGQYIPDVSSLGQDLTIKFGDPIGQLLPIKRQDMVVELVDNNEFDRLCKERNGTRKDGGFGSTG